MKEKSDYPEGSITILDFVDGVRSRPGMYIGTLGSEGGFMLMKGMAKEILELNPASTFTFSINAKEDITISFSVNGNKVPYIINVMESRKSFNDLLSVKVASALANEFYFSINNGEEIYSRQYVEGKLIPAKNKIDTLSDNSVNVTCKFSLPTLTISFISADLWKFIHFLHQLACQYPNASIFIEDKRGKNPNCLTIERPNGLIDLFYGNLPPYGYRYTQNKFSNIFYFEGKNDAVTYQILIDHRHYYFPGLKRMSFYNGELCEKDCSHEKAVLDSIVEMGLELKVTKEDLLGKAFERSVDTFNIYISAFQRTPIEDLKYSGSTKHHFISPTIYECIKEVTVKQLRKECIKNVEFSSVLANLID